MKKDENEIAHYVRKALDDYFRDLDGEQPSCAVYDMVMNCVEKPLIETVLYHAGEARLIPGTWLLLYGSAVLSATLLTAPVMMRLIGTMGALFALLGAVAYTLPPGWHNLVLGGGFGVLHLVFGLLIGRLDIKAGTAA